MRQTLFLWWGFRLEAIAGLVDEFAPVLKSMTSFESFIFTHKEILRQSHKLYPWSHCQVLWTFGQLERLNLLKKLSRDIRILKLPEITFSLCSLTVKKALLCKLQDSLLQLFSV